MELHFSIVTFLFMITLSGNLTTFLLTIFAGPDYPPLVENKRLIEVLQERITLTSWQLVEIKGNNQQLSENIKGTSK